jgi:8-oxo-dGTP pyrophosphatase MutT (NUDIX family)
MLPDLSQAEIVRRLAAQPEPLQTQVERAASTALPRPCQAAVLLPLYRAAGAWQLLYIRRAKNLRDRHSGEVAFPGGRMEPGETDPAAAALREAWEEIGLDGAQVELLGRLPPFETFTGFRVAPVVGRIPWPLELVPDAAEVAHVFSIPLAWLANPDNHEIRPWPTPEHPLSRPVVFFRRFTGEKLWGVSARITLSLLEALRNPA